MTQNMTQIPLYDSKYTFVRKKNNKIQTSTLVLMTFLQVCSFRHANDMIKL